MLESWEIGKLESWAVGILESWKFEVESWKVGKLGSWKIRSKNLRKLVIGKVTSRKLQNLCRFSSS